MLSSLQKEVTQKFYTMKTLCNIQHNYEVNIHVLTSHTPVVSYSLVSLHQPLGMNLAS